jgi:hypothetical protein
MGLLAQQQPFRFSITNALIASKSVTAIATLVAISAVPFHHKRCRKVDFESSSMQMRASA